MAIERDPQDSQPAERPRTTSIPSLTPADDAALQARFYALSPDLLCVLSADAVTLRVSPGFTRVTGYSGEEFEHRSLLELVHPDDAGEVRSRLARVASGEPALDLRHRALTRDGRMLWLSWAAILTDGFIFTHGRDVSNEMRAATMEAYHREILALIVSGAPLETTLGALCLASDEMAPGTRAGLVVVHADNSILVEHGQLPDAVLDPFRHAPSEDEPASSRDRCRVEDLSIEPRWRARREVLIGAGLHGCWSLPLRNSGSDPMGTLVVLTPTVRAPSADEREVLDTIAQLASLAVDHQRSSEAIRRNEERFRLFSKATRDLLWDWNTTTDTIWWGDGYDDLFKRSAEPTRARSWAAFVHPDDRARVELEIARHLAQHDDRWELEYRVVRADGTSAHVLDRGFIVRDDAKRATRVVGGLGDLTESKRAEQKLREQAALLEAANDAIVVLDIEGRITFANRSACTKYGWPTPPHGTSFVDSLQLVSGSLESATLQTASSGVWSGDVKIRRADTSERTLIQRWTLIRDERDRPRAMLVIATDITEKRLLENQSLRAQRMESLGTLAGGIAHDLNNVLAPILLSIGFLQEDETDSEKLQTLGAIETSARRGAEMVKQVVSFARGMEGPRISLSPRQVLAGIESVARDLLPENIELISRVDDDLPNVSADAAQLHQVLHNLVVNARDAMPEGGTLILRAQRTMVDAKTASLRPKARAGLHVVFSISDTGKGIPADVVERMFEPFFTTKELGKNSGLGLGLATATSMVKSLGGFITVSTEVGLGSTLKVHLPALEPAAAAPSSARPADMPRGHGELILIVDDEPSILNTTRKTLEAFGYRVTTASDGASAVLEFSRKKNEIAAVVTDVSMPGMDGVETSRALLAIEPTLKIVLVSGLEDRLETASAMSVKKLHTITKPFSTLELLSVLQRLISPAKTSTDR